MKENFSLRLEKALKLRNMKPIELAEKSGVPKSAISQYLSGQYEAKQKNIDKLSVALNVSEAWLMGHDVPIERNLNFEEKITELYGNKSLDLLDYYKRLNALGKEKALESTKDLTKIQEYTEKKTNIQNA